MSAGAGDSRDRSDDDARRGVVQWFYASPMTFALSALLLVAVVGATVLVVVSSSEHDSDDTLIPLRPSNSVPTSSPPIGTEGGFDAPLADMWGRKVFVPKDANGQLLKQIAVPVRTVMLPPATPQGLMWQSVYGFALPFSTSDGPTRWDGDVATGFSHRPEGSALAGWQLIFRQLGPKVVQQQIARKYLALTPAEQTQFDDQLSRRPDRPLTEVGLTVSAPDAFRLTTYDSEFAVVEYAVRDRSAVPNTQWAITRAELVWDNVIDSWKLKGFSPQMLAERTASIEGWTQW
ncbi:hypothetical protein [Nocardia sp. 348MFTsu5.1]|uniref:hypothetical protein n=1 Tax=Nocardia sp. 348MFTsu5.1 TaxID=1172185 RepID=UPI00036AC430|nr:hypothetical protein [Nocardia sp. 348MFTsu5.1]